MPGTLSPTSVSTKLQRIAQLAKEDPKRALTTLAHHIDVDFLREAYRRTRKDGAPGVDRQTAERIRAESGGESPGAARPLQVGDVPGTASEASAHPEGRRVEDPPHRHPDLRGQSPAEGRRDGARGHLRAGVSRLLVRLPAEPVGASSAAKALGDAHGDRWWVGARSGHQGVLRLLGPRAPARLP